MADCGNTINNSNNTTSSRFAFFNRSLTTVHSPKEKPSPQQKAPQLERAGSLTKFVESARGSVVKRLCNFFEKPASPQESLLPKSKLSSKSTENSDSSGESFSSKLKPSKSIDNFSDSSAKFLDSSSGIRLPGTEDRIVLYFTSLRGIRRTYEDCYAVRMIFRGFRVWVDERDISMDSNYRKELMSVLGEKNKKKGHVTLPQVFIRGRHMGGADVIKQLCEVGELGKLLEGLPRTKPGFVCESCGDVRFVPCGNCSGSRKVFDEDEGLLKKCLECNENGLIRCPNCCS